MVKFPSLPKQPIHGVCRDLTYEGRGVVPFDQEVIFVQGMFPGEEGDVEIQYRTYHIL